MKLKLDDSVSSPQDVRALGLEVREYARWFGQNSIKARLSKRRQLIEAPAVSPAALSLIHEAASKGSLKRKDLDNLIAGLAELEAKSPRITITLAAIAPGSVKKSLVGWCRQHIAANVLVDFRFNSTLLGGMVVQYGSHVYDWSFRRQILTGSQKFPEVLRRV